MDTPTSLVDGLNKKLQGCLEHAVALPELCAAARRMNEVTNFRRQSQSLAAPADSGSVAVPAGRAVPEGIQSPSASRQ